MDSRTFNSVAPILHERWTADKLGMICNPNNGPDLISNDKIVEVKFTKFPNQRNYYKWMTLEHQMDYPENYGLPGFWAAGLYTLSTGIENINTKDLNEIEKLVLNRELYVMNWDWIYEFNPSLSKGSTKNSNWNNMIRYAKFNRLPETTKEVKVEGGIVRLTEGVDPSYFEKLFK